MLIFEIIKFCAGLYPLRVGKVLNNVGMLYGVSLSRASKAGYVGVMYDHPQMGVREFVKYFMENILPMLLSRLDVNSVEYDQVVQLSKMLELAYLRREFVFIMNVILKVVGRSNALEVLKMFRAMPDDFMIEGCGIEFCTGCAKMFYLGDI